MGKSFQAKMARTVQDSETDKALTIYLAELDVTLLTQSFAANHIKKFYPRGELEEEEGNELTQEEEDKEEDKVRTPEEEDNELAD